MYIFVYGEVNDADKSVRLNVQIAYKLSCLINEFSRELLENYGNLLLRAEGTTVMVMRAMDRPGHTQKQWAWVDYSPKTAEDMKANLNHGLKNPSPPHPSKPWYFN